MPPQRRASPAAKKKSWNQPCKQHCIVWAVAMDGQLAIVCAHCKQVRKKFDVSETYGPEYLMVQCKRSQKAHSTHCIRIRPYFSKD